jgi:tetratricopeptide (TPR) repeat protein
MKTTINRFICSSLQAGFYQQIVASALSFQELGSKLVRYVESARAFRLTDKVQEASQILIHLPLEEFQLVGSYYLGWSLYRNGQYEKAEQLLQRVVNKAPAAYQSRAMLSLAGIEAIKQDYGAELQYYVEAAKASQDVSTVIEAYRGIAILKAKEGYHTSSLRDLEQLLSLSKKCEPVVCYAYFNSFAVELVEAGRIEEATNISRIVLASPFAFAYPEWRETWQELALRGYKSRSSVRVKKIIPGNVFNLPEREPTDTPNTPIIQRGRARIFDLQKWKNKMVKEPNGEDENLDEMDFNELIVKLLQLTTPEEVSEKKLRKVVKSAIKILNEKD